ncbi:unnamed protein product, partial [Closterium sp. NIES-64]
RSRQPRACQGQSSAGRAASSVGQPRAPWWTATRRVCDPLLKSWAPMRSSAVMQWHEEHQSRG